jgi:hypothetical protein
VCVYVGVCLSVCACVCVCVCLGSCVCIIYPFVVLASCFLAMRALQTWELPSTSNGILTSFFTSSALPAPTSTSIMTQGALGRSTRSASSADWYAERLTGFFVPPYNATYTFYIAGDDWMDLALSPSSNASDAVVIASSTTWNEFAFPYHRASSQISAPVSLLGGQRYYMRVRHTEGGGLDWLRVAVRISGAPSSGS